MDSSSSNSSSSHYTGSAFPANAADKPRWELPIYESTPHFPPMDNSTFIALNSQHNNSNNNRFAPSFYSNHNCGGGAGSTAAREDEFGGDRDRAPPPEREHMFDKVVTPSDVGKLNRLVIPKQHAEKHFPLDSNSSEKGLLLDFEDRNGKSWRFRYSYWNSSQSYVMTKGWSRFVKEKKLDAGDVVSFQRGVGEIGKDRFYIDWRRRPDAPPPHPPPHLHHHTIQFQHSAFPLHRPYLSGPRPPPPLPPPPLVLHHHQRGSVISYNNLASGYNYGSASPNFNHHGSVAYMRGGGGGGPPQMQMELAGSSNYNANESAVVFDSVPVVHGGGKRLRLFGVNMDCTVTESASLAVNVPDSSIPVAETGSSALQLRLHGSDFTTDSTTTTTTIEFLDKGKSSMSLDFDI